jgi:hypothetical protein
MINHARTLLLNESGPKYMRAPGDVIIPSYRAIALSGGMQDATRVLFGHSPDYEGKLQRVARYMSVLHSTEFASYLTALDSRLTYDPYVSGLMEFVTDTWSVTPDSGIMLVQPSVSEKNTSGRGLYSWSIQATSTTAIDIVSSGVTISKTVEFSDGQSQDIVLPGTATALRFVTADNQLVPFATWNVRHSGAADIDLGQLLAEIKNLDVLTISDVFRDTTSEPFKTFYALYKTSSVLPYSLSGFLLAYIYRMEDIRLCQMLPR